MGAEGARRSTGTKGAQRKLLFPLHPNTMLPNTPQIAPPGAPPNRPTRPPPPAPPRTPPPPRGPLANG